MINLIDGYWNFTAPNLHQRPSERDMIINFISGESNEQGLKIDVGDSSLGIKIKTVYIVRPKIGDYLDKFINALAHADVTIKIIALTMGENNNPLKQISEQEIMESLKNRLNSNFNTELPLNLSSRDLVVICQL